MKPSFRRAFELAGVDTTRNPSETEPTLAKDTLNHAVINCELQKARAEVRAKLIIENFKNHEK